MEFGVSYPAGFDAVRQAVLAGELGFAPSASTTRRPWNPTCITIANAMQATKSIRIGAEVLIPHLRHPMAQAAAMATVEAIPTQARHLAVHDNHTVGISDHDRDFIDRHPDTFAEFVDRVVTTPAALALQIERLAEPGVTHADGPALAGRHCGSGQRGRSPRPAA